MSDWQHCIICQLCYFTGGLFPILTSNASTATGIRKLMFGYTDSLSVWHHNIASRYLLRMTIHMRIRCLFWSTWEFTLKWTMQVFAIISAIQIVFSWQLDVFFIFDFDALLWCFKMQYTQLVDTQKWTVNRGASTAGWRGLTDLFQWVDRHPQFLRRILDRKF